VFRGVVLAMSITVVMVSVFVREWHEPFGCYSRQRMALIGHKPCGGLDAALGLSIANAIQLFLCGAENILFIMMFQPHSGNS
jgi:hypothetical protein